MSFSTKSSRDPRAGNSASRLPVLLLPTAANEALGTDQQPEAQKHIDRWFRNSLSVRTWQAERINWINGHNQTVSDSRRIDNGCRNMSLPDEAKTCDENREASNQ